MAVIKDWKKRTFDALASKAVHEGGKFLGRQIKRQLTDRSSTKNQNPRGRDGPQIIDTSQNFVTQFVKNKKTKQKSRKTKFEKKVAKALLIKTSKNIFFQYSTYATWATDWGINEGIQQIVRGQDVGYTVGGFQDSTAFPFNYLKLASENVGWVKAATAVAQKINSNTEVYVCTLIQVDYTFRLIPSTITTATCVIMDIYECIAAQTQSLLGHTTPASSWITVDSNFEQLVNGAGNALSKGMTPWQSQGFGQYWTILKKTRIRMTPLEPHCYQLRGVPGVYNAGKSMSGSDVIKGKTKGLLFVICPEQYKTGIATSVALIEVGFNRTCHWKLPNGASVVNQNIKTMGEISQYTLSTL